MTVNVQRFPVDLSNARRVWFRDTFGAPRADGRRRHAGQDLGAPRGTPVLSPVDGRVVRVYTIDAGTCGFGVTIRDDDGNRWTLCHFNAPPVVDEGPIRAGDVLGVVGTSGNAPENAPHLHVQCLSPEGIPINLYGALRAQRDAERAGLRSPTPAMVQRAARGTSAPAMGVGLAFVALVGLFTFGRRRVRHV